MDLIDKLMEMQPVEQVSSKGNIQLNFERFHQQNHHVLRYVVRIAQELKKRGFTRAGMKLIFERLRWLYAWQTRGDDYKLNNNYTAYYARVVMLICPDLDGFFKVRKQRTLYEPDLEMFRQALEEGS